MPNTSVQLFEEALLATSRLDAENIANEIIKNKGLSYFFEDVLPVSLEQIGKKWEKDDISLSQVYMSGRICEQLVNKSLPKVEHKQLYAKKMAIVNFDTHHSLGKKIVYSLLVGFGYNLLDYGHGVDEDTLIQWIKRDGIKILLVSILMLPSAFKIRSMTEKLEEENISIKILVGGAPFRFDKELWKEIKVDAMAESIYDAHKILSIWMEE